MGIDFEKTTLRSILKINEFKILKRIITYLSEQNPDIEGVLLTGSLVQKIELPQPQEINFTNKLQRAYAKIVSRTQRKLWHHPDSDLDLWILTKDLKGTENISQYYDTKAIELVEYLAKNPTITEKRWIKKKQPIVNKYYKNKDLYSNEWNNNNPDSPWIAKDFSQQMIKAISEELPEFCARVNHYFNRKYSENFFEIRASPTSIFNLRPEKIKLNGSIDRTPFPYFISDWLNTNQNTIVVYKSENAKIYPFDENGKKSSTALAEHIGWNKELINSIYFTRSKQI